MRVETLVMTPYQTNCYLVDEGETRIVIDPGEADAALRSALEERPPQAVVCTHAHPDHVGGVPWVLETYSVPFYLHPQDAPLLERFAPGVSALEPLSDEEVLTFGPLRFRVWHTPGHAPGEVILREEAQRVVFSGDLVFAGSVGRTDFPGSDPAAMERSLRRLLSLAGDYTLYPGHGPRTQLGQERRTNPFLVGMA